MSQGKTTLACLVLSLLSLAAALLVSPPAAKRDPSGVQDLASLAPTPEARESNAASPEAPGARYGSARVSRFAAYDVVIDSGNTPLAAYQVVITPRVEGGGLTIVGIEGGESAAYSSAPYYDPKAIQNDRVILAAYSTKPGAELPHGKTRVARVHLMIEPDAKAAEPFLVIKLEAAGTTGGERIDCTAQLSPSIEAKQGDAP